MKKLLCAVLFIGSVGCYGDVTEYGEHLRTINCEGEAHGQRVLYRRSVYSLRALADAWRWPGRGSAEVLHAPGNGSAVIDVAGWVMQPIENPLRLIVDAPEGRAFVKDCIEGIPQHEIVLPEGAIEF